MPGQDAAHGTRHLVCAVEYSDAMLLTLHRRPGPPLSEFVDLLWYWDGYAPAHGAERLLPTGTIEFVMNLDHGDAAFAGARSGYFTLPTTVMRRVIGAHFHPGGAFPFLGVPAGELQDMQLELGDPFLREAILEAPTPESRLDVLERALLARLRGSERHPAVSFAVRALRRTPSVAGVTEQIGMSTRRFSDLFRDQVGLTPKVYHRVMRFQSVLRRVWPMRDVDWTDVALACGYYDQPHFIHDFRAFSGLTPSQYLAARGDQLNHVPILTSEEPPPAP